MPLPTRKSWQSMGLGQAALRTLLGVQRCLVLGGGGRLNLGKNIFGIGLRALVGSTFGALGKLRYRDRHQDSYDGKYH